MSVERVERSRPKLHWWKELAFVGIFYLVYSWTWNRFGSHRVELGDEPLHAFNNALHVVHWERVLHLFHEPTIQGWFLDWPWFMQFWNTYYGTAHFIVTVAVFVWLYRARPDRFPLWRNVLGATTALAIIGFSLFPLMPPRLLDSHTLYGGARLEETRGVKPFGLVDSLEQFGGPWSFDSGAVSKVSNQYAAMPSLHIAWSAWCALVVWELTQRRWVRILAVAYPFITLFGIVVTGNHYFIDAIGGLVTLAVGYVIGRGLYEWNERRLDRRAAHAAVAIEQTASTGGPVT